MPFDSRRTVAIDFDGTLVEGAPLQWRTGAREFLVAAPLIGLRLVLHSCRTSPARPELDPPWAADEFWAAGIVPVDAELSWRLFEEMRAFMMAEGVWDLVELWTSPGKPIADLYVDNLGAAPNWPTLARELGVNLAHGKQVGPGGSPLLGAGQAPRGPISAGPDGGGAASPAVQLAPAP